jgi:hypothetical protein
MPVRMIVFEQIADVITDIFAAVAGRCHFSAVFQCITFPDLIREKRREGAADGGYLRRQLYKAC